LWSTERDNRRAQQTGSHIGAPGFWDATGLPAERDAILAPDRDPLHRAALNARDLGRRRVRLSTVGDVADPHLTTSHTDFQ